MKILKFGGSSVGSAKKIKNVAEIISKSKKENKRIAVVVSAFGDTTDKLIKIGNLAAKGDTNYKKEFAWLLNKHVDIIEVFLKNEHLDSTIKTFDLMKVELDSVLTGVFLIKELSLKTLDFIMSFGERFSAYIISEILNAQGINSECLDARNIIKTDDNFGFARVHIDITYNNIKKYFESHNDLQVITGFIGSSAKNETTTLGRNGTDYTASLIGAALNADVIEIWTDVDGFMTADPKKVKKSFPIDKMTYEEAIEMSHFGAKVIHPPTMRPALEKGIPIIVKNTFNQEFKGTVISTKTSSQFLVRGISSIDDIALLRVQGSGMIGVVGISERIFKCLAEENINVILISQASSEHSICFAVEPGNADKAKKAIEQEFSYEIWDRQVDEVKIERNLSAIAVVGENMRKTPGISGRLFQALGRNGINVIAIAQGSSERNISVVINRKDESKALNAIHEAFFLSDTKTLNLFIVGTGLVGSTLIGQIKEQSDFLLKERSLEINVIAIANTKKMFFDKEGIELDSWKDKLSYSQESMNLDKYIKRMKKLNLPKSVFVDCTASDEVSSRYDDILSSNISIVTPNKRANSGKYAQYQRLKKKASQHNVRFIYETNVGAGLPIISTLNDLLNSGDEVLKIEAILSGTLNYIFYSVSKGKKFSEAVFEAKKSGLSEPDPREDLSGLDMKRKLLILAREIGLPLELEDIYLESILPEECRKAKSIDDFFIELRKFDDTFEQCKLEAEKKNKVLRYVGTIEDKKAWASLQEVDEKHPFYSVSGSDNVVVFTTKRYKDNPLVIKGPGAGVEVTAAGVFADIIRIFYN